MSSRRPQRMKRKSKKELAKDAKLFEEAHGQIEDQSARKTTWKTVHATSSSYTEDTKVIVESQGPPAKRPRTDDSDIPPPETSSEEEPPLHSTQSPDPVQSAKKRKNGASEFMRPFLNNLATYVSYLLGREYDTSIGSECRCGLTDSTTRCLDCLQAEPTCSNCFIALHKNNPCHWAGWWNGDYFEKKDISTLGYAITLGHRGDKCPQVNYNTDTIGFHLVDVNGIHETRIAFCKCSGTVDRFDQLMKASIFPASVEQPQTGFTFTILEMFHMDCLSSKKSAYDYVNALRRRTNNAFPDDVPNVYPQFLRVMRIWRALQMWKRSGQSHNIDKEFPNRLPGSVVVPCFACPEPGFNMEEEIIEADEMRHLESLWLAADGHFGLMRKIKTDDPDDIALTAGMAFFPDDDEYQEYLRKVPNSTDKSTCANLSAANMQNKLKFTGCATTGVVAVTCGRHNTFKRGGLVDLQKGEKYANTDYALAGTLLYLILVQWIVLTYDIACQYSVNLQQRFKDNLESGRFKSIKGVVGRFTCLVPKLHLQGHKDDCQYRWSLNFTRWMGRTDGERIEAGWAEAKQAGGMTKEMNAGHRHDVLNDFQNDWNWTKAQRLTNSLYRHLTNAKTVLKEKLEHYQGLSKLNGQQRVDQWLQLPTEPYQKGKKNEWHSVYRPKEEKVPSQAKVYHELVARELQENKSLDKKSTTPTCVYLNMGLKIQSKQRHLAAKVKLPDQCDADRKEIDEERLRLRKDIKQWRHRQEELQPAVTDIVVSQPFTHPELEKLFLPSDLSAKDRDVHKLAMLAADEMRLREGEAYDALRSLRSELKHGNALYRAKRLKKNHIVGQDRNLRSLKVIYSSRAKARAHMAKYTQSREAMISLGLDARNTKFPELRDEDTYFKDVEHTHQLGDGRKVDGWLWRIGNMGDMSEDEQAEYQEDADRVQWFRSRADLERWQEEVEILGEEFRRAIRGFEKMSTTWALLSRTDQGPGHVAYAKEKSAMYARMGRECREKFVKAGGTFPAEGVRLADHVKSERTSWVIDWSGLEVAEAEDDTDIGDSSLN